MSTYYRPQAHRPPPWWVGLLGLIAMAIVVAAGVWFAFAILTSLQQYVPTLP